jgi:hypothetical protein
MCLNRSSTGCERPALRAADMIGRRLGFCLAGRGRRGWLSSQIPSRGGQPEGERSALESGREVRTGAPASRGCCVKTARWSGGRGGRREKKEGRGRQGGGGGRGGKHRRAGQDGTAPTAREGCLAGGQTRHWSRPLWRQRAHAQRVYSAAPRTTPSILVRARTQRNTRAATSKPHRHLGRRPKVGAELREPFRAAAHRTRAIRWARPSP